MNYVSTSKAAQFAHQAGLNFYREVKIKGLGLGLYYTGEIPEKVLNVKNVVKMSARAQFAPELVKHVVMFLTKKEAQKRGLI